MSDETVLEIARMILAHPQGAVIVVAGIVVAGIVVAIGLANGVLSGPATTIAGRLLDLIAPSARSDADGTFKLPGTRSKHRAEFRAKDSER